MDRKGRKVIRSGLVPQGGESEEKGDYMDGNPPWGVSSLSHILGAPDLASNKRKTSPLGWLEDLWH